MTYLYEELKAPTRLYIKQCPHCGLKYFGKTVYENIEQYTGSGKRWLSHLKKHKVKPLHLWNSDWYYNTSIARFAIRFSKMNKIVENNQWANYVEEDGLDGGDTFSGKTHSEETRAKMSLKAKEDHLRNPRVHREETKRKISKTQIGKKQPESQKRKVSAALTGLVRPEYTCPHCNRVGRGGNMIRYHFDNCKRK
jgi:hypothetical protein